MSAVDTAPVSSDNPLSRPSQLPFGLPPFGDITPEHSREALLAGMAEQRAEVAAIVATPRAADLREHRGRARAVGCAADPRVERVRQPDVLGLHAAAARDRT